MTWVIGAIKAQPACIAAGRCGKSSLTSGSNLITCSLLSRALFCGRPAHWITVVQPLICRSGEALSSFRHHFQACDCYDDVGPQKGETLAIVSTKMPAIVPVLARMLPLRHVPGGRGATAAACW